MNITRAELKAAIDEAHRQGIKVTGHLCSVTYPEAAELGIDNLEHGFFVNTQLDPGKQPDQCPRTTGGRRWSRWTRTRSDAKSLIALLVQHHVALTSDVAGVRGGWTGHPPLQQALAGCDDAAGAGGLPSGRETSRAPSPTSERRNAVRIFSVRSSWSGVSWLQAACCWRVQTRPAMDMCFRGLAISARSSCWCSQDLRPWKRYELLPLNGAIYMGRDKDQIGIDRRGQERGHSDRQRGPVEADRRYRKCRDRVSGWHGL